MLKFYLPSVIITSIWQVSGCDCHTLHFDIESAPCLWPYHGYTHVFHHACITIMDADVLGPNRCQAISSQHAHSTPALGSHTVCYTTLQNHRVNSPVIQTTPEPTLLSGSSWPFEKNSPHPWPHGKPGLMALIGPLRPYCSQALWSCSGVSWK